MNKKLSGIHNPIALSKAHFDYELIEDMGNVKNFEYEEYGQTYSYPEKQIVIKSLNGGSSFCEERFLVTLSCNDVYKPLREGEIISIKLRFSVRKDENGNYVQTVSGDNLYTLNDYYQIREAKPSTRENNRARGRIPQIEFWAVGAWG